MTIEQATRDLHEALVDVADSSGTSPGHVWGRLGERFVSVDLELESLEDGVVAHVLTREGSQTFEVGPEFAGQVLAQLRGDR